MNSQAKYYLDQLYEKIYNHPSLQANGDAKKWCEMIKKVQPLLNPHLEDKNITNEIDGSIDEFIRLLLNYKKEGYTEINYFYEEGVWLE